MKTLSSYIHEAFKISSNTYKPGNNNEVISKELHNFDVAKDTVVGIPYLNFCDYIIKNNWATQDTDLLDSINTYLKRQEIKAVKTIYKSKDNKKPLSIPTGEFEFWINTKDAKGRWSHDKDITYFGYDLYFIKTDKYVVVRVEWETIKKTKELILVY